MMPTEHDHSVHSADSAAIRISVVVTTCNRAYGLPKLFSSLRNQTINGKVAWEFIIVDNGSTDNTRQVVSEFAATSDIPVVYVHEAQKGKSRALNAGVKIARGPTIAFTDDDGIPATNWLENVLLHFDESPEIACVGGRVELYDPADALVTVRLSKERHVIDAENFSVQNVPVIGCNIAIEAATLRKTGPYDVDVGPGSRVGSGDDLDMQYRLVRAGNRIGYDPHLLVLHNHGRRTASAIKALHDRYVIGRGGFYCKYILEADRRVAQWAYWELTGLLARWLRSGLLTTQAWDSLCTVALLLTGAVRYLRYRQARSVESTGA